MRIIFERTGGFAGTRLEGSLDCATLPRAQAKRLRELIKKSGFFDLPRNLESGQGCADQFSYRVTVETAEGKHTVEAGETAIPDPLRPLLDFLTRSIFRK